jgi:1-acyl-sn-glycerol-3-phosphate acyltransferase
MAASTPKGGKGTRKATARKAAPTSAAATPASPKKTASRPRSGSLAAGAARASGERAKRRSTPLIQQQTPRPTLGLVPDVAEPVPDVVVPVPDGADTATPLRQHKPHRPHPVANPVPSKKAVAKSGTRTPKPKRRSSSTRAGVTRPEGEAPRASLQAVPDGSGPVPERASRSTHVPLAPGIEELLRAGVAALRITAETSGLAPEEVERQVAQTLSFLRRRLTGNYTVDEFGFDEDFTEHAYLPLLRPLYRKWFRVEVRGIENIPSEGGALVVANHSGTIAMDSLMTQVAVHDEHPAKRHLRMLGADLVFQTPVVGQMARRSGSTLAANPDAERLLSKGELAGVWPEGFKGVGKPFSERYKLQRFGRGGFVSAALRTGVPIIPCSIVGAEEIYPIIGNMKTVARLVGAPYAPITPTWPLLGPLGLVPLPSKWIIEFGSPVETADLGPGAADDPMLTFDLTDQVRETIQQTLYSLLMQRRSVFF